MSGNKLSGGRRALIFGLLGAFVAASVVTLAVYLPREPVHPLSIQELWRHREKYIGKRIEVRGTVRIFLAGQPQEHFAVESADLFRVGIAGLKTPQLRSWLGRSIVATGTFLFDEEQGGYLDKPRIEDAGYGAPVTR